MQAVPEPLFEPSSASKSSLRRRQGQQDSIVAPAGRGDGSSLSPLSSRAAANVMATANEPGADCLGSSLAAKSSSSESTFTMFDPHHLETTQSPFRGIFYMCWLSMFAGVITTCFRHYRKYQCILGTNTYMLMTTYLYDFLIADAVMILCLFVPFFIQVLFARSVLPICLSPLMRHAFQSALVFAVVYYCLYCQTWSYIQTSVLLLHTIAMYMKVHSYSAINEKLHRAHVCKSPAAKRVMEQSLATDRCIYYEGPLCYPHNITLSNYIRYLAIPSLIYQLNPIKAPSIRWGNVAEKTVSALVGFMVIYIMMEHWVQPILYDLEKLSLLESVAELLFPFTVIYFILFYMVFECLCNWFAELTRYGSRNFYEDWWNSTTFEQFARKWNKPVHQFLFHHIYEESMVSFGWKKSMASSFTFFFSSLLHEFCLAVICKKVQIYFFLLQMTQVPLIYIGKLPVIRRHPLVSNLFFWSAMMIGPPFLCLIYCRDYFIANDWRADYRAMNFSTTSY